MCNEHRVFRAGRRVEVRMFHAILLAVGLACSASLRAAPGITPQTEEALLRGDWGAVATQTSAAATSDPVARLVRAHALLAQNHNDDSACTFVSADPAAIEAWDRWTAALVSAHGSQALAWYFRGDALARRARWPEAIEAFTRGLERDRRNPLLLNARGVSLARAQQWDAAVVDLDAAARARRDFADAYANRGVVTLLRGLDPRSAITAYDQALKHSPHFALAEAGRASAKAVLKDRAADQELKASATGTECRTRLVREEARAALAALQEREKTRVAAFKGDPGTTLHMMLADVAGGNVGKMRDVISLVNAHPELPELRTGALRQIDAIGRTNPALGMRIERERRGISENTSPASPAGRFFAALEGVAVTLVAAVTGSARGGDRAGTLVAKAGGSASAAVDFSAKPLATKLQNDNLALHNTAESLRGSLGNREAGGADTDQDSTIVSLGDFPVVAQFGLLYRATGGPAR
jgi:tetratricopeptide (TPR) repeat protein